MKAGKSNFFLKSIWGMPPWSVILVVSFFVVVVLTYFGYRIFRTPENRSDLPSSTEVKAGESKAQLTFTDGRAVNLFSSSHGELARQGNSQILQCGEGMIFYNTAKTSRVCAGYNIIATPRGGQYSVVLPDGTKVWLNSASWLKYPVCFNANERRVEVSGEAYFTITRDIKRPFVVTVRQGDTSSSGTEEIETLESEFNVRAHSDGSICKTTLIEGDLKIRVGGSEVRLLPGQQYAVEKKKLSIVNGADPLEAFAWKNGLFFFEEAEIQDIMKEVERWYDVGVVYKQSTDHRFNARIPMQVDILTLLQLLENNGWVHFELKGRLVVVR